MKMVMYTTDVVLTYGNLHVLIIYMASAYEVFTINLRFLIQSSQYLLSCELGGDPIYLTANGN